MECKSCRTATEKAAAHQQQKKWLKLKLLVLNGEGGRVKKAFQL